MTNSDLDSLDKRLEQLTAERALIQETLAAANLSEDGRKKLVDDLHALSGEISTLALLIRPEVEARHEEAEAIKEQQRIFKESSAVARKFNDDILSLADARAQKETDIYRKLNDNIVKAVEKAADDAERALRKLTERRADLRTDLGRDIRDEGLKAEFERNEARIEAQQEEAESLREHLRTVRDIRDRENGVELQDALRSRDFASVRRIRTSITKDLQRANREFVEGQAEQILALQQRAEADNRGIIFERAQRLQAFQDKLSDLDRQFARETAAIDRNKRKALIKIQQAAVQEITLLDEKVRREFQIKSLHATAELGLIRQTNQQRLALEAGLKDRIAALYAGNVSSPFGSQTTNRTSNFSQTNNFQTGAGVAQQQGLATIIQREVAAALERLSA